jgi:hypothetical protein
MLGLSSIILGGREAASKDELRRPWAKPGYDVEGHQLLPLISLRS